MPAPSATIHATAVLVGDKGVLIRGPSGSGKSRLAMTLIHAGQSGILPPSRLIGDDRISLTATPQGLVARPAPTLAGLIEIYGLGIRQIAHEASGLIGLVVDLAAADAERLPPAKALQAAIDGISISRVPVAAGTDPFLPVVAALTLPPSP